VESTADTEVLSQSLQHATYDAGADPLLKAAMAGLVGRITLRQIGPRSTGAQNVQNSVKHFTPVFPGPATAILAAFRLGNQGVKQSPLGVGQVSGMVGRHFPE